MSKILEISPPVMLTIKEAAKAVKLSQYCIRKLVLQQKVRFIRSGTKYLLNYESLIDFLNAGEPETIINKETSKKERI